MDIVFGIVALIVAFAIYAIKDSGNKIAVTVVGLIIILIKIYTSM